MKILALLVGLVMLSGCATTIERLRPDTIYKLEDGHQVTVYRTYQENIYVVDKDTIITPKEK